MVPVTVSTFFGIFLVLGLVVVAGMWLFYDLRDRRLLDRKRQLRAYHCVKCGCLYGSRSVEEVTDCPVCRFRNASLRF